MKIAGAPCLVLCLLLSATGCGDSGVEPAPDSGVAGDAEAKVDAALSVDSGSSADASEDAGASADSDASSARDAELTQDAALTEDTGYTLDALVADDAGGALDASIPEDVGCGASCPAPRCGDGRLDPGEQCDDGAANSDTAADACRTDCQQARCGDGVADTTDQCPTQSPIAPVGLWAWGDNQQELLGLGNTTLPLEPARVSGGGEWTRVAAGLTHSLAIRGDGTLWAWGQNTVGQLGLGDTNPRNIPTQVGADSDWVAIGAGIDINSGYSAALKANGTLWTWGRNNNGQLGQGDNLQRTSPTQVGRDTDWVTFAAGGAHVLAIKRDKSLWAWGSNTFGQLGYGNTTSRNVPVRVGTLSHWAKVAAGAWFSVALSDTGALWTWGRATEGQLGFGNTTQRNSPGQLGAGTWLEIAAGEAHSLAVSQDGSLWAWGANLAGQLGLGDASQRNAPAKVGAASDWQRVAAGTTFSFGIRGGGTLWSWGENDRFQLGYGNDRAGPQGTMARVGFERGWTQVAGGRAHALGLKASDPTSTSFNPLACGDCAPSSPPPPDPATTAPAADSRSFASSIDFLFTGPNPVQTGVEPGAIDPRHLVALRGRAVDRAEHPLPGVTVTVHGHPELGQSVTRSDGTFDLVANSASVLLNFHAPGFLPIQRRVDAPELSYVTVPEVAMTALDPLVTTVHLGAGTAQVARGTVVEDSAGPRQATVIFPIGVTAALVSSVGDVSPLERIAFRATEYTVGPSGHKAMPGELPPASAYTYAVELSADEALSAQAVELRFSAPVTFYVDNFLGFPVGEVVPVGVYDRFGLEGREPGRWVAEPNGRVVGIVGEAGGLSELDFDGDGAPDADAVLTAEGVTLEERGQLASLYAPGKSLWRTRLTHFTPFDLNWPFGPPPDAKTPPPPKPEPPKKPDPCEKKGSIVYCEAQAVGETLPVVGAPFALHYRSDRLPGHRRPFQTTEQLTDATPPASLRSIEVQMDVAGRTQHFSFSPAASLEATFGWDGLDRFGREVRTPQVATLAVTLDYPLQYYASRTDLIAAFGRLFDANATLPIGAARTDGTRQSSTVSFRRILGIEDPRTWGVGGWTPSILHHVDVLRRSMQLGDGTEQNLRADARAVPYAATCQANCVDRRTHWTGGVPWETVQLETIRALAVSPDGTLHSLSWFDTGQGTSPLISFRDGLAYHHSLAANYDDARGLTFGSDGTRYITADTSRQSTVWRFATNNRSGERIAGGASGYAGDGGPASAAQFRELRGIAMGPDGALYLADSGNHRIRRIDLDGTIETFAGDGSPGFSGDGGPASHARLNTPVSLAFGPDATLYFTDQGNRRVRAITLDGKIRTVAGNGAATPFPFDGRALEVALPYLSALAVDPRGRVYFSAINNNLEIRVYALEDGFVRHLAGRGGSYQWGGSGDAPATTWSIPHPVHGLAVLPDGRLAIGAGDPEGVLYTLDPDAGLSRNGEWSVRSNDGLLVYAFDGRGRHLRTLDALSGALRFAFTYNARGQLEKITDGDANETRLEWGQDQLTIVAPEGQRTTITLGAEGMLQTLTEPSGARWGAAYQAGGLLTTFDRPVGDRSTMSYDIEGALVSDRHSSGVETTLERRASAAGHEVILHSSRGDQVFRVLNGQDESVISEILDPDGRVTRRVTSAGGTQTVTAPDRTVIITETPPNDALNFVQKKTITRPSGVTSSVLLQQQETRSLGGELLTRRQSVNLNDAATPYTVTFDKATRTVTRTTVSGQTETTELDAQGRILAERPPGLAPMTYEYDAQGRLRAIHRGTGADRRTTTFAFYTSGPQAGGVAAVTDPEGRVTSFGYDAGGRMISRQRPGGHLTQLTYDDASRPTSVVVPGPETYNFAYGGLDRLAREVMPNGTSIERILSQDRLGGLVVPGSQPVNVIYAATGGRVEALETAEGDYLYEHHADTGQLVALTHPNGVVVSYAYDGPLVVEETWSGPISGRVAKTMGRSQDLEAIQVNGAAPVAIQRDPDRRITAAGSMTIARHPDHGLVAGTSLGGVATTTERNAFGEETGLLVQHAGTRIFEARFTRDRLGRVSRLEEWVQGQDRTCDLSYEASGALIGAACTGAPAVAFGYDARGNRSHKDGQLVASYDGMDRLLQASGAAYEHDALGARTRKLAGAEITTYEYGSLGHLTAVRLPDGTQVAYEYDARNRQIGRQRNGSRTRALLYQDQLRPIAELDANGNLRSQFVYATRVNVPDYLLRGGKVFRLVSDPLGSVRLVVDVDSGEIVQRLDYDFFGDVVVDTQPGFQPFGFAGGIYDPDTRLVHFGSRDYDPAAGRWIRPDLIRFSGGATNLYEYASNDPVNLFDPTGFNVAEANCAALKRFIENGDRLYDALMGDYYPMGLGQSPNVNADYESILGPVDIDWMINDALAGTAGLAPGLAVEGLGELLGSSSLAGAGQALQTAGAFFTGAMGYFNMKPLRNLVGGVNPLTSILDPAQTNAYEAAAKWLAGTPAEVLFSPAIEQCKQCGKW